MPEPERVTDTDSLLAADRALQAAQFAADADALAELIDDRLVFTGPDGQLYSKEDIRAPGSVRRQAGACSPRT
jgi:Domain of unknown function (DUF4440)